MLCWFLDHKKIVLTSTAAIFAASIGMMGLIKEEFFPPSVRPEILIKLELPEAASQKASAETGPPAEYPVLRGISGYDAEKVRQIATQVTDRLIQDSNNYDVSMDWNEKSKVLHLDFDQAKLRQLGLSPQVVAQTAYTEISGASAAQFYAGDRTINVDLRLREADRSDLSRIKELPIYSAGGYVP